MGKLKKMNCTEQKRSLPAKGALSPASLDGEGFRTVPCRGRLGHDPWGLFSKLLCCAKLCLSPTPHPQQLLQPSAHPTLSKRTQGGPKTRRCSELLAQEV